MNYLSGWRKSGAQAPQLNIDATHFSSGSGAGSTRSLELVRYNGDTGKFELGEEALSVLRNTRGPVGVVAVAGRARQGKSYILNQLLGRSGGFTVGPTHRPCTKGLWMWSAPVQRTAPDGSKYSLVLLDTEGIDAYDQTGQYSTQIFSLAVLLSSLFLYNQMGGIDEAALDRLSLVTEMTKHIRVRASDGVSADPSELSAFTPSFVWLLRDFYLKLEEDGRNLTPRDYLESALQLLPGTNTAVQSKNNIRESIKALFPDRDCFTLVRPVNEEEALAKLDTLPSSQLRPEFKQGLANLTKLTFQKAMPKRLGSQVLTGASLAALAEAYVGAINAGAVPTIATAWQGVAEAESRRAADAAEAAYAAAFPQDVSAEDTALENAHQSALLEAQRAFDAVALGDESVQKANEKRWRESCASRFREYREKKLATAELACERAINEASARLADIIRREGATLDDLQKEAASFQERYSASRECSGPAKWRRLADFMRDVYGNAQRDMAARQAERQKVAAEQAQQAAASAQAAVQQASARATEKNKETQRSIGMLQEKIIVLERQFEKARADLATETAAHAATSAKLSQISQSTQSRDSERAAMAEQLRKAQGSDSQTRSELLNLQQQVGSLHQLVAAERTKADGLQRQVQESGTGWASEKGRMEAALDSVTAARDAAQAARSSAEAARTAAEQQAASLTAQVVSLQNEIATLRSAAPARTAAVVPSVVDEIFEDAAPEMDAAPSSPQAPITNAAAPATESIPDTAKMTVAGMKTWLTDHGYEAKVWEMSQSKAKKADWAAYIDSLR